MKKIIFIESSDLGTRYCADACQFLGFEAVFVTELANNQGDTLRQLQEQKIIEADTTNPEKIHQEIVKKYQQSEIAGITSFLDSRLNISIEVGKKLGVPTLDSALLKIKSKTDVFHLIPEFSPSSFSINTKSIDSWSDLKTFLEHHQTKNWVLKPALTAGAYGMSFINKGEPTEVYNTIRDTIEKLKLPEHLASQQWLLQQRIEGELVSLEGFFINGKAHQLGITGRGKVKQTESRVIFPSRSPLHLKNESRMLEAIQTLAFRSGFKNGYFHSEFLMNQSEAAVLIDSNFGRLGGGSLIEQIALSYGISEAQLAAHIIATSLPIIGGLNEKVLRPKITNYSKQIETLGILYGIANEGIIESVVFDQIEDQTVNQLRMARLLDNGQSVPAMGLNNWGWVGTISGPTAKVEEFANNAKATVLRNNQSFVESLCY